MRTVLNIVGLILLGLCCNGCATHSLLHAVGVRQEVPANITQAWAQKGTLVIDYTAVITDGDRHCLKSYKPIERRAAFDLNKQVSKNQYNIGQIQTNMPPLVFSPSDWTFVPRVTEGVVTKEILSTNAIVIEGSQAGVFRVIGDSLVQTNDFRMTYCRLETRKWTLWWRRPAQVIGFPFACLIDVIVLPFNAAGWGIVMLQEKARSNSLKNHET